MIVRKPRKRPPSFIKVSDIDNATRKNGAIDLSKVRRTREKRKEERRKRSREMLKVQDQKRVNARYFTDAYEEIVGGKYDLRKSRFRMRKVRGENAYKRSVILSDVDRLWAIRQHIKTRFSEGVEAYKEYIEYMLEQIMENSIIKKNGIIGYIENEERIDEFCMQLKRRNFVAKKAGNVRRRSEAYSEYFDDE